MDLNLYVGPYFRYTGGFPAQFPLRLVDQSPRVLGSIAKGLRVVLMEVQLPQVRIKLFAGRFENSPLKPCRIACGLFVVKFCHAA